MNALIDALNHGGDLWWRYALHAAWQATLLAVVVLIVVRLGRRWPAPLRYWLLVIALVKFAMPPMLHAPIGVFSRVGPQLAPTSNGQPAVLARADTLPVLEFETTEAPDVSAADTAAREVAEEAVEAEVPEEITEPEVAVDLAPPPVVIGEETPPPDETPREAGPVVAVSMGDAEAPAARAGLRWQAWLLVAHVFGVIAIAAWTLWQVIALRRTVRRANLVRDGELYERFIDLWRAMSLRRPPRLLVSPEPIAPMVIGVFRPAVVVPAAAKTLAGRDLDTMLTHELAHVRRRDTWINWFQIIVVAVWWFNPVIWLLNRAVRKVREDCCDDLVLSRGHSTNDAYCQTLLHAASRLAVTSPIGARLGFADRLHPLGRRLRRIMDRTLRRAPALSLWGILLIAFLAVILLPGLGRRGETTEPKTDEQADSEEGASEAAETSDGGPELGKFEMELAAQEKALADRFEAAAKLKYTQIDAITAEHKREMLSEREAGEQIAKLVRDMAEDRLRAVELRLSAAERELSTLKLSVPPGSALPDAAREKTDEIKSLRSQVKKKQYDFADGITHVVNEREGRIARLRAEQEAGHLPARETNIEIANLQLLNAQDKMLVTKLRYLAESHQTYSAKVLGADTRGAVMEPGARPGVDEVLHWETLLLEAEAELIRHEHEWGAENANRKAQEKIIALYKARLEEARKQAWIRAQETESDKGQEWKTLAEEQKKLVEDYRAQLERLQRESGAAKVTAEQVAHWERQVAEAEVKLLPLLAEYGEEHQAVEQQRKVIALYQAKLEEARKQAAQAAEDSGLPLVGPVEPGSRPELNDALLDAAKEGNLAGVKSLLERGAFVSTRDEENCTPLHWALRNGFENMAIHLIEHGADVNGRDTRMMTPLLWAAYKGYRKVVELLVAGGAELDARGSTNMGTTALGAAIQGGHVEIARLLLDRGAALEPDSPLCRLLLVSVAAGGKVESARLLIDKGADPNGPDDGCNTPLLMAARWGRTDMLRLLFESGATLEAAAKAKPDTQPLLAALENGRTEAAAFLLKKGADPNARDMHGLRPLHTVLNLPTKGNVPLEIKLLIDSGADVNAEDSRGHTSLHYALDKTAVKPVEMLLAAGADPNPPPKGKQTPLQKAVKHGSPELVEILLKAGADANAGRPLDDAVRSGNSKIAKLLLAHGADPNVTVGPHGGSALCYAAFKDNVELTKLLLAAGADPNTMDRIRRSPLFHAVSNDNKELAKLLLDAGADPVQSTRGSEMPLVRAMSKGDAEMAALLLKQVAKSTITKEAATQLLTEAIANGQAGIVKILLEKGADPNMRSPSRGTPLIVAMGSGNKEITELLLKHGADPTARVPRYGSLLHYAVSTANAEVVTLVLKRAGDPAIRDSRGQTLLHTAVLAKRPEMAKLLLDKKADPNARDNTGWTPLHHAVDHAAMQLAMPMLEVLIAGGADVNARDQRGDSPLHLAVRQGYQEVVKVLLEKKADPDTRNNDGATPLRFAVEGQRVAIAKILLENKADPNIADKDRRVPLHIAAEKGDPALVKLLVAGRADPNLKDKRGFTPLHYACRLPLIDTVAALVAGGAKLNVRDGEGNAPLHTAIAKRNEALLKLLLKSGADANLRDKDGDTPLHVAVRQGNEAMVALLLEGGADVQAKGRSKRRPLHDAADTGDTAIARRLLAAGADVNAATNSGATPLHGAARWGFAPMVKLLLEEGASVDPTTRERYAFVVEVVPPGPRPLLWDPTPLLCAAAGGHTDAAALLVKAGADVNAAESNAKRTPLHWAAMRANEDLVRLLLESGANPRAKDSQGKTALDMAKTSGHAGCLSLLTAATAEKDPADNADEE